MGVNTASYGPLNERYVTRVKETLDKCIKEYPRTMVLRLDLHFPADKQKTYRKDSTLVTKFIASLKSQIDAEYKRKDKSEVRVHKTSIRYIWVREVSALKHGVALENNEQQTHYHVALMLNKDAYAYPGTFYKQDGRYAHNLSFMIMEAWVRALNLHHEEVHEKYYPLVHFPKNPFYHINKNRENFDDELQPVIDRLLYFAKIYTKENMDGYRNFGCSQS
ncbi:inovirus Gp2 family protein [Citrobacter sp. JGM124]|uniref:inovirus Gp2 family protein n=1 Tax=Citrobacter sp. JGM124 TaxID=2799789 RepID=UPI001BAD9567|nr:inovirus Gp2 family protein [Citrobacter sp. JGM124]MBS0849685.1 inovirus Gp2 family protein [Citrobacter sp. JGM124]